LGSFLGFCDRDFTTPSGKHLVFSTSFLATTECSFTVLKMCDLRRCLRMHGNAELTGASSSGQFLRLVNQIKVFNTSKAGAHHSNKRHSISGSKPQPSTADRNPLAMLKAATRLHKRKLTPKDHINQMREDMSKLRFTIGQMEGRQNLFQTKVMDVLSSLLPNSETTGKTPQSLSRPEESIPTRDGKAPHSLSEDSAPTRDFEHNDNAANRGSNNMDDVAETRHAASHRLKMKYLQQHVPSCGVES